MRRFALCRAGPINECASSGRFCFASVICCLKRVPYWEVLLWIWKILLGKVCLPEGFALLKKGPTTESVSTGRFYFASGRCFYRRRY